MSSASTPTLGFHCAHEQHPPSALLRLAQRAEEIGFTAAMCSDHFHPWLEAQGHSGFSWSWLGAAMQATQMSFGVVCAPGHRYHPAMVAQAAATLSELYSDRFWLAVGTGEALNESITGATWPTKEERTRRLRECVDIMRALWAGETVTHRGLVQVKDARLYSRPARAPMLVAAALTPETAAWAGTWADALLTVPGPRDSMRALINAFRGAAGDHKPIWLQVPIALAASDEEGARIAWTQWRQAALTPTQLADLDHPRAFEAATRTLAADAVLRAVRASADVDRQIEWLREDAAMGFTRIYLHNVNPKHQRFFEVFAGRIRDVFG